MKRVIKIFTLLIFIFFSSFLTYKLVFFLGEKYFFDKLFYKKSEIFGYTNCYNLISIEQKNSKVIEKRIEDLRELIAFVEHESGHVLGTEDEAVYRVAVIGDSFVYGMGVKQSNRFPEILEKKLNQIRPTEVLVFAHPGDGLLDNYVKFFLAKQHLDIDLFIVGIFQDDLAPYVHKTYTVYSEIDDIIELTKASCPGEELSPEEIWEYWSKSPGEEEFLEWIGDGADLFYHSFSDQYANVCYLEEVIKKMTKDNVLFLSFVPPPDLTILSKIPQNFNEKFAYALAKYLETIKKYDGKVVFCFDDSEFFFESVSDKEGHASKKTHRCCAESLFKEIVGNPKYNF